MKYLVCDFYDNFECIGSQCPSTCCAGWDILIDKETNAFYDSVAGEFGDALRKNILPVNETIYQFALGQNGRCPFLTQENLCEIYQKLGPEKMCFTCRTLFPYTTLFRSIRRHILLHPDLFLSRGIAYGFNQADAGLFFLLGG